jgi:HEAT repeat protein
MAKRWGNPIVGLAFLLALAAGAARVFPVAVPSPASSDRLRLILDRMEDYRPQGDDPVLLDLQDYVQDILGDPAGRRACEDAFITFLEGEASSAAHMEICRQLRRIGTERSVPVLSRLLRAEEDSDAARFALEAIPGAAAGRALLDALDGSEGGILLGIVNSLGRLGKAEAVPAMSALLDGGDPEIARAAADALGRIDSPEAAAALRRVLDSGSVPLRMSSAGALLHFAERALAAGDLRRARDIYRDVYDRAPGDPFRPAALRGMARTYQGSEAAAFLVPVLKEEEDSLRAAVIPVLPEVLGPGDVAGVASVMEAQPPALQVMWLRALTRIEGPEARAAVLSLLKSQEPGVRIASLRALSSLGRGEDVARLVGFAAASRGEEQAAAREALNALKTGGPEEPAADVDRVLLSLLAGGPAEDEALEILRAVGSRKIRAGWDQLVAMVGRPSEKIRLEAARSLAPLAGEADGPDLLEMVLAEKNPAVRMELVDAAAASARKHRRQKGRAAAVAARLAPTVDSGERAILLRLLGRIGDDGTLSLVRDGLSADDPQVVDAAVRALADWPTSAAGGDLYRVAFETGSLTHHVLCLRAYIETAAAQEYEKPEDGARTLLEALEITRRDEERILVLGLLPEFPCEEALAAAELWIGNPDLELEARKAAERIRDSLK